MVTSKVVLNSFFNLRSVPFSTSNRANILLTRLNIYHDLSHTLDLSRDVPTIGLLTEKSYTPRNVETNAKSISGRTAKEQLQTVDPSAEPFRAFTAMLTALENAERSAQTERTLVRDLHCDQDIFKDAIEFQSEGSLASSCPTN